MTFVFDPEPDPAAALTPLVSAAAAAHGQLQRLFGALADGPPDAALERQLAHLREARDQRLVTLGLAVLGLHARGLRLSATPEALLGPPADSGEIVPDLCQPSASPAPALLDVGLRPTGPLPTTETWSEALAGLGPLTVPPRDLIRITDQPPSPVLLEELAHVMHRLGPPPGDMTGADREAEARRLDLELDQIARWERYPRAAQRALLGLVVARLRALQDDGPAEPRGALERTLRRGFARASQFSTDQQPGWVTGLSRGHRPDSGRWDGDARHWWRQLEEVLRGGQPRTPTAPILDPSTALEALDRVLAEAPSPSEVRRAVDGVLRAGHSPEDTAIAERLMAHLDALQGDKTLKKLRRSVRRLRQERETSFAPGPVPSGMNTAGPAPHD